MLTRKRFKDPQLWERNQRKLYRNLGQEYTNSKGKKVSSRKMKPVCSAKCRLKCFSKITENKRQEMFDYYWQIGSIDSQRTFINSCMSEITPMYRNTKPGSTRSKNFRYTFQIDNSPLQVCKTFFKNTLGINNRVILTTTKKKDENGMITSDQRGKHNKQRKISNVVKNDILEHIRLFPSIESHYCRSRMNKTYLDGSLNIKIMYKLYIEYCNSNNKPFAKHGVYAHILNIETNVGFHVPKKDQCSLCENYKNANDETKDSLKEKFESHLKEK
ncbi:hypothetical protein NQ314_000291 [Rhamnusium bicolor]|uniref:Uncharacterized protein n=1 Tax=Rhamnusium bicolor TaxID=1586634 RepID=A0AAV8ZWL4_9CUCU|nr:hypothetical protein NQ314_000291 [Rhamnusium bicolor]